jgi:hypothetical protein
MKKLCPSCNTHQDAAVFNLSDKEILNARKIGMSEDLCLTCYKQTLTNMLKATKADLIPLNEQKNSLQAAYYTAYNAWKERAKQFEAIDYNLSLVMFETQKKEKPSKQPKPEAEPDIDKLCKQIFEKLSKEQQATILQMFQNQPA